MLAHQMLQLFADYRPSWPTKNVTDEEDAHANSMVTLALTEVGTR